MRISYRVMKNAEDGVYCYKQGLTEKSAIALAKKLNAAVDDGFYYFVETYPW